MTDDLHIRERILCSPLAPEPKKALREAVQVWRDWLLENEDPRGPWLVRAMDEIGRIHQLRPLVLRGGGSVAIVQRGKGRMAVEVLGTAPRELERRITFLGATSIPTIGVVIVRTRSKNDPTLWVLNFYFPLVIE